MAIPANAKLEDADGELHSCASHVERGSGHARHIGNAGERRSAIWIEHRVRFCCRHYFANPEPESLYCNELSPKSDQTLRRAIPEATRACDRLRIFDDEAPKDAVRGFLAAY
jgi:hypothetical protein